ncbi:MAG: hypothetical protein LBG61_05470 [Burkholderiales bacterium]|nr:hypothetical protein [Burkholderiales bacterium]
MYALSKGKKFNQLYDNNTGDGQTWAQPNEGFFCEVFDVSDPAALTTQVSVDGDLSVTKFVVAPSGGIMSKQNFFGELNGWTFQQPSGLVYNRGVVKAVQTNDNLPRLCVGLDYLFLIRDHQDDALNIQPVLWELAEKPKGSSVKYKITVHPMVHALNCITTIKLWRFNGSQWESFLATDLIKEEDTQKEKDVLAAREKARKLYAESKAGGEPKARRKATDAVKAAFRPYKAGIYEIELEAEKLVPPKEVKAEEKKDKNASSNTNSKNISESDQVGEINPKTVRWFCEIGLKDPSGYGNKLSGMFDVADAWLFPIQVKNGKIHRPTDNADGEVPNWTWLQAMDEKYPDPMDIIIGSKAPKAKA